MIHTALSKSIVCRVYSDIILHLFGVFVLFLGLAVNYHRDMFGLL